MAADNPATGTQRFGLTTEGVLTSAAAGTKITVATGLYWFANGESIVDSDIGSVAYCEDNQTVQTTSTSTSPVGVIQKVDSTLGVLVNMYPHDSAVPDDSITAAKIAAGAVDTSELAADAVDGTKIEDDAVDSEHIAAGAIDLAHMSANSVDSDQYVDGSIDLAHMSANSVDSDQYVDASIDTAHIALDAIDGTLIGDDVIDSEHYAAASIDNEHLASNAVDSDELASGSVDPVHLATGYRNIAEDGAFAIVNTDRHVLLEGVTANTTITTSTSNVGQEIWIRLEGATSNEYELAVQGGTLTFNAAEEAALIVRNGSSQWEVMCLVGATIV
jgi:hypothetical protein